jgi:glyoxylase-like metal-dependent hydrolase (beta-lactamase superfamily II)
MIDIKTIEMDFVNAFLVKVKDGFIRHMSFEKFKPDLYLTDGQNMNAYGLDAQILHIPGHTKGSIGILTEPVSQYILMICGN